MSGYRPVRESDVDALHALDQICFEPGIAYSRGEIRRFLALPTARGIVLEDGPRVAAFAIGYRPGRTRGTVVTIDVHPVFRKRGIGFELLSALIERLTQDGARDIGLEVDVTNRGAIAFYERMGFRRGRTLPGYYGAGRDAYEMELATSSRKKADARVGARAHRSRRSAPGPAGSQDRNRDGRHPV